MEKVKRFLTTEMVLSLVIPFLISFSSYLVAQAKTSEGLVNTKERIESIDNSGTKKLQQHLIDDANTSQQLLAEIRVIQTKVDQIRTDIQELKSRK